MSRLAQLAMAGALMCALALVLVACGGRDKQGERPDPADGAERNGDGGIPAGRRGGTLRMLAGTDVDFLDPGRTYFASGLMVALATQRPLYGYAPDDLSKVVPNMASALPKLSADGKTVTVRLRRGVRFSPPVSREVTSRDVAYAFERFFSVNVGGPYMGYFSGLVGAPAAPTKGVRRLSGITTPSRYTIVFRLKSASAAPVFVGALSLPASSPVPEEYARRFDAKSPSTYNTHVVATGPYMVRNDAEGDTVGYRAGESIELVRNPGWSAATDTRPAYLDAIRIRTNANEANVAARQVLAGSHMVQDTPPPPSILKRVQGDGGATSVRVDAGGYRFLPLNTTLKPFDNVDVRRAVVAGFDREAARKARGGEVTGPFATHFLPPGLAGFEAAGGLRGPGVDFLRAPGGDDALAASYMKRAGFPDGKYHGDETFLLVSANTPNDKGIATVTRAQLEKLGFKTRLRYVTTDALVTDWCPVPAKKVLTCASSIAWLKDFPDPQPMLQPQFDGRAISKTTGNTNYSQFDDPEVNAAIDRAIPTSGAARARAWGEVDRLVTEKAAAIPLQWDVSTLVKSRDVVGVPNVYYAGWDLTYTSLK